MVLSTEDVRRINPVLKETPNGWLAISETLAPLRIAVVGATETEARQRFAESREAWAALQDQPGG